MNWLDIVILVFVIASAIIGLKTGLIAAVMSLAGIIVGVMLAGRYYMSLAGWLSSLPKNVAEIIAFAVILIVVMIIAALLAKLLKRVASAVMLGWLNHLGGFIFGLLMGAITCAVLLAIWVRFLGISEVISYIERVKLN